MLFTFFRNTMFIFFFTHIFASILCDKAHVLKLYTIFPLNAIPCILLNRTGGRLSEQKRNF